MAKKPVNPLGEGKIVEFPGQKRPRPAHHQDGDQDRPKDEQLTFDRDIHSHIHTPHGIEPEPDARKAYFDLMLATWIRHAKGYIRGAGRLRQLNPNMADGHAPFPQ